MTRGVQANDIWKKQVKLKPKKRTLLLGLIFSTPLIFMLYISQKVDGRLGLRQPSDQQIVANEAKQLSDKNVAALQSFHKDLGSASLQKDEVDASRISRQSSKSISKLSEHTNRGSEAVPTVNSGPLVGSRRRVTREISSNEAAITLHTPISASSKDENDAAQQQQQQQLLGQQQLLQAASQMPARKPNVWLYTLLGADYEGTAELLPHWLQHYLHTLQFSKERLLIVVNHHSSRSEAAAELAAVQGVLEEWGLDHVLWTGKYSSDAHLKVKLQLLSEKVTDVNDWIVIADSDEFHSYSGWGTIDSLLQAAEEGDHNWVLGQMVDRVSKTGQLAPVQAHPSLFEQYPYNCHMVRHVSRGSVWKVMAAKAYWRTNTGNHYVVEPELAKEYFGGAEAGSKNPRGGWFGAEDLWALTPYSKHYARYQHQDGWNALRNGWRLSRYPVVLPVFHFKWHHGVLQSAADRFAHYSGNVTQPGGMPRYKHYQESWNILEALSASSINLQVMQEAQCNLTQPVLSVKTAQ